MDNLAFLESEEQPEATPEVETPAEVAEPTVEATPEAETPPEQPRGPDGKFAAKEREEPKPDPVMVPLAALHETRDKLRELEAKFAQQKPQEQDQQTPDIFEDPEGRLSVEREQFQQALYAERLNSSRRFAVQQHGDELVNKALQWGQQVCAQDPRFNEIVRSQADPVGFAIDQYKRDQVASQVDLSELEQFKAWKALQAETQQSAPQAPQVQTPPQSIASMPSSGGADHTPTGPGQAFDTLFRNTS